MKQNFDAILDHIAKQEGISKEKVLEEMQRAIDVGYNDPDPAVQAHWAAMPFDGKPTPEALIAYLAAQVQGQSM
ncbi:MAG: sporulation initiation factor Spo0A [Clostridia bacterium]|nr:sporulation initiation factor Spo0A [Clostridia bacterium]